MSDDHAFLAPSFAPVWGRCSAAPMAAQQYPSRASTETREGNAAHWVVSEVLGTYRDTGSAPECLQWLGRQAPNGMVIDDKMVEGAQVMVDDVVETVETLEREFLLPARSLPCMLMVEFRINMPHIHEQNWGTLDCALYLKGKRLYLWDYKHGHRECRAEGNLQLIDYAEGLRHSLGLNGVADQNLETRMRIVQPFCYKKGGTVDEWTGVLSDLRAETNGLHMQAHAAFTNPTMTTGLHCRDCPAQLTCAARRRADGNFIDMVNQPYEMDVMSHEDKAVERKILEEGVEVAKERIKALDDDLTHHLASGVVITGYALESKVGNLAWTVAPPVANALANQFGFDIAKAAVKTPTQAKQAAPKAVRAQFIQVLESITHRPMGGLKLAEARNTKAAKAFKRK